MFRVVIAAMLGALVGLGLGWGLFGGGRAPDGGVAGSADAESASRSSDVGRAAEGGAAPAESSRVSSLPRAHLASRSSESPSSSTCPTEAEVASRDRTIASLLERLQAANEGAAEARAKAEAAEAAGRGPRYDAPTAAGRRMQAARKGNLLVEFPDWNDRLTLRDGVAAEHGLDAGRAQELEDLYAATNARLRESLQKLYAELVGDPEAGRTSTLNALLHDVMSLSPQEACNQRLPALLQALADDAPLPDLGADPLPCAAAVQLVFQTVDQLDERAVQLAGEAARKALWSGSSTFEFGSRSKE